MSDLTPARPAGSLIERTAAAYGLTDLTRAPAPHPMVEPPAAFAAPRVHAPPEPGSVAEPAPQPVAPPPAPVRTAPVPFATIDRIALAEAGMIVPGGSVGVLAEEFRRVKRQLLQTARQLRPDETQARTILVASARPDEGKTFCAINLALSLAAEGDLDVLLVDGDVASRGLMPRLGQPNGPGFLDLLADPALDPEALVVPTDVPHLSLLGAGTRMNRDAELIASDRTGLVLERLLAADPNRIVIFDSPPALGASPASAFARHAGQVLFVVRADATAEREIRDAVALLDGCAHIRLLLNQVRHPPSAPRFSDPCPAENGAG